MENTEGKKTAKVWPRDFISSPSAPAEQESSEEINLEKDLQEEQPLEEKVEETKKTVTEESDLSNKRDTIIRVKPIHVEAKVIDIK